MFYNNVLIWLNWSLTLNTTRFTRNIGIACLSVCLPLYRSLFYFCQIKQTWYSLTFKPSSFLSAHFYSCSWKNDGQITANTEVRGETFFPPFFFVSYESFLIYKTYKTMKSFLYGLSWLTMSPHSLALYCGRILPVNIIKYCTVKWAFVCPESVSEDQEHLHTLLMICVYLGERLCLETLLIIQIHEPLVVETCNSTSLVGEKSHFSSVLRVLRKWQTHCKVKSH